MATIGLDAGTSGCKGVLLSRRGDILQSAWAGYPTRRRLTGEASQDATDWERAIVTVVRACAAAATEPIDAISITAPAHNLVLLGAAGRPVRRVMLWADTRPSAVAKQIRSEVADLFDRTFVRLTAGWSLPQMVWIRRHEPDVSSRIRLALPAKDYLRFRLTGEVATDPTDAAGTALYDVRAGQWAPDLLDMAGLALDEVPPVRPALALGGHLRRSMAHRLGLKAGLPVAVGATDTAAELLAAGIDRPGEVLVKIASTGTVVAVSNAPRPSPGLLTYPHAIEGRWYALAATNTAATAYAWLREIVYAEAGAPPDEVYARMGRRASRVPPGAGGLLFLPFLQGERTPFWDEKLRGAFLGVSAAHGRSHLCRAVLEGVAMSLRMCRDEMASAGFSIERVCLAGGGTASSLWRTIVASALGCSARVSRSAGPGIGAAIIASHVLDGGARPRVRGFRTVHPRNDWTDAYEELFAVYREAADMVGPISHRLVSLSGYGAR